MKAIQSILFVLIVVFLAACTLRPPTATPGSGGVIEGQALVDTIDLAILESFPVQVNATLKGSLPDGCTTLGETTINFAGNIFEITIATSRPADAVCTQAVVPFEQTVALDVLGLPAGDYTVRAGAASAAFNLAIDNVLPDFQEETPTATGRIEGLLWHDICAISGGEGGEPAVPSAGCIQNADTSYKADGILTPDEPGLAGVEVQLHSGACDSPVIGSIFTNIDGAYAFDGLAAGPYCVTIDQLANPNSTILIPGEWTSAAQGSAAVDLAEGEVLPAVNFGWDYQFLPDPATLATVTPTPGPTGTPEPNEPGCTNIASFVDETIDDGTVIAAGQHFTKTWTLENAGTCKWTTAYKLVFVSGDQMNGAESTNLSQNVPAGDEITLSAVLLAPQTEGTYRGDWMLEDEAGNQFGLGSGGDDSFWVEIQVEGTVSNLNLGLPDWTDPFNNSANWFLIDNNIIKWTIEDGKLRMRAKVAGGGEQWGLSNQPSLDDFYLEAVFTTGDECSGLDRYGLLVRAPEPNAGYVFNVSCNGQYRVYEWDGSNYNQLQGWTSSSAIKAGTDQTNRVGVWAEGDDLKLYINDILVFETEISIYDEGEFGLLVGSANTVNFDVFVDEISYWHLDD